MFAGMMFGAIGWGACEFKSRLWLSTSTYTFLNKGSDLMGRSTAFNATLFFTSIFGLLASFATSFVSLCVILFFLGSAVGVSSPFINIMTKHLSDFQGSMPTAGTLLLEHLPNGKQYLVTALSVFFSFGAVLSAVVAILIVPQNSCTTSEGACDLETENRGWQYMLLTLGIIVRITTSPPYTSIVMI